MQNQDGRVHREELKRAKQNTSKDKLSLGSLMRTEYITGTYNKLCDQKRSNIHLTVGKVRI